MGRLSEVQGFHPPLSSGIKVYKLKLTEDLMTLQSYGLNSRPLVTSGSPNRKYHPKYDVGQTDRQTQARTQVHTNTRIDIHSHTYSHNHTLEAAIRLLLSHSCLRLACRVSAARVPCVRYVKVSYVGVKEDYHVGNVRP